MYAFMPGPQGVHPILSSLRCLYSLFGSIFVSFLLTVTASSSLTMRSFTQFALAFASLFLVVHADYWMGDIAHQGVAPYAASGYSVFRSVKDYGAVGM